MGGRYDPALLAAEPPTYTFRQVFPPDARFPAPGAQHPSIDAAMADAGPSGTGTILDIMAISATPQFQFATLFSEREVAAVIGVPRPTRADVEAFMIDPAEFRSLPPERLTRALALWNTIPRGQARIVVLYEQEAPRELFIAGMSFD